MPISLAKGQKVSLTKDNPGLSRVIVGLGWDVNAFDTGGDFDLDAAAFMVTESGKDYYLPKALLELFRIFPLHSLVIIFYNPKI